MRLASRTTQNIVDLTTLTVAYWAAWLVRYDGHLTLQAFKRALFDWPYLVTFEFVILVLFGIPRFAWRYVGLKEAIRVAQAVAVIGAVVLLARFTAGAFLNEWPHAQYAVVPVGVNVINAVLCFLGITGVRLVRRVSAERESSLRRRVTSEAIPTLLIGAGEAGALVARELEKRPDLGIDPVGFLDDNPGKQGSTVHGIRVLGSTDQLVKYANLLGAKQALITIAELDAPILRRILKQCEDAGLPTKLLPGLYQVIDGQANLGRLRDVSIEDLLRRDAVKLDMELVLKFLRGKRVMITGAGGSIGSELCRQVARLEPAQLSLVERSEFALFTIEQELRKTFPELKIIPRMCDICDAPRVEAVFEVDQPEILFHAAAHKHVPMMEYNPGEAIKNNVFGTKTVADVAHRFGLHAFVMISTDKAVNPTSIMGATKRVAEKYIQALSGRSETKYVAVRFGNVLGSTGSVIPTFKDQIAAGGPVTVTHPEMKRYFMTIPEASQLVMQAAAMGQGGEIFVLDMGTPVKIVDLAYDLIRLSGLVPEVDIKIEFTGMRPGEKLFEELGFDAERLSKTAHPKIYTGRLQPTDWDGVTAQLRLLEPLKASLSESEVRGGLHRVVPEMASVAMLPVAATSNPANPAPTELRSELLAAQSASANLA